MYIKLSYIDIDPKSNSPWSQGHISERGINRIILVRPWCRQAKLTMRWSRMHWRCQILLKYLQVLCTSSLWVLRTFLHLQVLYSKFKLHLQSAVFLSGFQCSPRSFEMHWARHYLVNFTGVTERVNAIVYMTEPIFTWQVVLIINTLLVIYFVGGDIRIKCHTFRWSGCLIINLRPHHYAHVWGKYQRLTQSTEAV